jgi:hypothetical protein
MLSVFQVLCACVNVKGCQVKNCYENDTDVRTPNHLPGSPDSLLTIFGVLNRNVDAGKMLLEASIFYLRRTKSTALLPCEQRWCIVWADRKSDDCFELVPSPRIDGLALPKTLTPGLNPSVDVGITLNGYKRCTCRDGRREVESTLKVAQGESTRGVQGHLEGGGEDSELK